MLEFNKPSEMKQIIGGSKKKKVTQRNENQFFAVVI